MLFKQGRKYSPVATEEVGDNETEKKSIKASSSYYLHASIRIAATLLITSVLLVSAKVFFKGPQGLSTSSCTNPVVRREWRSVSREMRAEYIAAVLCLHETPSSIDPAAKLSDDFPWAHAHLHPSKYHRTSNFLPWHRYFIHVYEKALKDTCGYTGHLLYWDWTLDHSDPGNAPVFDVGLGFGGDGGPEEDEVIQGGSCIREGPFSQYEVRNFMEETKPHCLSRGFGRLSGGAFVGPHLTPSVVQETLQQNDYYDFLIALENGPHNDIPMGIGGDWLFTAPNDPLFFLHHTQVDRLWWKWQEMDHGSRKMQYTGPDASSDLMMSTITPSLEDIMAFSPLAEDIRIRDLMSTESVILCYRY